MTGWIVTMVVTNEVHLYIHNLILPTFVYLYMLFFRFLIMNLNTGITKKMSWLYSRKLVHILLVIELIANHLIDHHLLGSILL